MRFAKSRFKKNSRVPPPSNPHGDLIAQVDPRITLRQVKVEGRATSGVMGKSKIETKIYIEVVVGRNQFTLRMRL